MRRRLDIAQTIWERNSLDAQDAPRSRENLSGPRRFALSIRARTNEASTTVASAEFPCELFMNHYDPNNPEGQRNAIVRAGALSYRAKYNDEKAAMLLHKLGKPRRV